MQIAEKIRSKIKDPPKLPVILAAIFFLLLPLSLLAVRQPIKLFKKAYLPISPPISPPITSSVDCVTEGHGIPVTPEGFEMVCCPGLTLCPPPEGLVGSRGTCQRSCTCPLKSSGDANCDGRIDLQDFFIWRREFLETSSQGGIIPLCGLNEGNPEPACRPRPWQADFNNDGRVNLQDFFIWRRGFLSSH